jgi:hypothetical protein
MNIKQAKEIPLVDYLDSIGSKPVKVEANRLIYKSIFTDEKTPSMFVTPNSGDNNEDLWNDFSSGKGGTIIDLVIELNRTSIKGALAVLSEYKGLRLINDSSVTKEISNNLFQKANPKIKNVRIQPLKHFVLLKYLREERKIPDYISTKYLSAIFYDNDQRQNLFGIGWKNQAGGYEIRSAGKINFKSCTVQKDITFFEGENQNELVIFESMLDFLSYLTLKESTQIRQNVIILNSTTQIKKVISVINNSNVSKIYTFFDNDEAGEKCNKEISRFSEEKIIKKMNYLYENYNDLNDFLTKK